MAATRTSLAEDLLGVGLTAGDTVMVHGAFGRVGEVLGGPDALVDAILDVVGVSGTLVSYQDWELGLDVWTEDGSVRADLRPHTPAFDPATARPARDHGVLAATIGTRSGVLRSANPGASVAAVGARARDLTRDHRLDDGYGVGSPFARFVEVAGTVLMVGAPLDTMTLLHHAEALADIDGKRRIRREYPMATEDGAVRWVWAEEFDTAGPVVDGLADDYFADVVGEFLASGAGARGVVGDAEAVLVPGAQIVEFATAWLESRFPKNR